MGKSKKKVSKQAKKKAREQEVNDFLKTVSIENQIFLGILIPAIVLLVFIPPISILLFIIAIAYKLIAMKKRKAKAEKERKQKEIEEQERLEAERIAKLKAEEQRKARIEKEQEEQRKKEIERQQRMEAIQRSREETKNNPAEYERLNSMCKDIVKETKALLNEYKDFDIEIDLAEMISTLEECERKIGVIEETVLWNDCFDEDIEPLKTKITNAEKRLMNAYFKMEKENESSYITLSDFVGLDFASEHYIELEQKIDRYNEKQL